MYLVDRLNEININKSVWGWEGRFHILKLTEENTANKWSKYLSTQEAEAGELESLGAAWANK